MKNDLIKFLTIVVLGSFALMACDSTGSNGVVGGAEGEPPPAAVIETNTQKISDATGMTKEVVTQYAATYDVDLGRLELNEALIDMLSAMDPEIRSLITSAVNSAYLDATAIDYLNRANAALVDDLQALFEDQSFNATALSEPEGYIEGDGSVGGAAVAGLANGILLAFRAVAESSSILVDGQCKRIYDIYACSNPDGTAKVVEAMIYEDCTVPRVEPVCGDENPI